MSNTTVSPFGPPPMRVTRSGKSMPELYIFRSAMSAMTTMRPSLWISDVHLGTSACKAALLAAFLKHNDCERLYLVGDIIDGWALKQQFWWPQEHSNVIRRILTKAKRGTEVIYVTGNHDEFLRK